MQKKIEERRIIFPPSGAGRPRHKLFLNEMKSKYKNILSVFLEPTTADGTREVNAILGDGIFDFPKPSALLKALLLQTSEDNGLILDFFAGSGTIAHAAFELNREESANIQVVMVQLPEPTPEKSAARNAGYHTIADIAKERMRRVIAKMQENVQGNFELRGLPEDLGFAVFKLAESHYRQWAGVAGNDPERYAEEMEMFTDPLLPGWKPENVIWEVALKEGYSLTARIEQVSGLKDNTVCLVTDPDKGQSFRICLDDKLQPETVKALGLGRDDRFICRDMALTDELAANLALQCRLKTI
jgi:adenine-specific DNA-methyltransferase